jgi:integrase
MKFMAKNGPPAEAADNMLMWKQTGPWKKTIIYSKEIPHWEELQISVRRGAVQGRLAEVKTEYSEAQVPLDGELARLLRRWRSKAEFTAPTDWIFASPSAGGTSPYFPTALRRKIHAAAARAGLSHLLKGEPTKIFRHSYPCSQNQCAVFI